ncbi:MAG: metal-dependent hydrolase [Myxococcaceae bacterium]|nr:metal-dependent hydrolase [Myxococcaceae bacterium]
MATALTHAVLPMLAGRALAPGQRVTARWLAVAGLASTAADLDALAPVFGQGVVDVFEPRGLGHSLLVAAVFAVLGALAFPGQRRAALWRLLALAASHGAIDGLTLGAPGVAWLLPFSDQRFLLPLRPINAIPLGLPEVFSAFGAVVLAQEVLVLWLPVWLAGRALVGARDRRAAAVLVSWAVVCVVAFVTGCFAHLEPRPLRPIPAEDSIARVAFTQGPPLTRFDALEASGLFGRPLTPVVAPWSSSFFPAWLGSEAGRWQDGTLSLAWRTITGTSPPTFERLEHEELTRLSPAEKYDLAVGDPDFPATRAALARTHNGHPRFWFGFCNGVAGAALSEPEPFRVVRVDAPGGRTVRFFPQDIRALLAVSYYWQTDELELGGACPRASFDSGATCSMNPATFALALLNLLGRERRSFLVDVFPSPRGQYAAIASATVTVVRPPYPPADEPRVAELQAVTASLVDLRFDVTLSSTELGIAEGIALERPGDPTRYRRIGVRPSRWSWSATVALDAQGQLLGGRWTGDPPDGPDSILLASGGPLVSDAGTLVGSPGIRWPVVQALARASVSEGDEEPTLVSCAAIQADSGQPWPDGGCL